MNALSPRLPRCRFLGWKQPASELVAQRILESQLTASEQPMLIVVPTKESARLLKEQLAIQSARGGAQGACLSPQIIPSNQLLNLRLTREATPIEELFCWQECLTAQPQQLGALFHASERWQEQSWLYQAQQLVELFETLARDGVHWQDARLAELAENDARWAVLLSLKAQQVARLAELSGVGVGDPSAPALLDLPAATRIILACVPQLSIQLQQLLAASGHTVEVWVHAPPRDKARFDSWGCPLEDWLAPADPRQTGLHPESWSDRIVLCPDHWSMAQQAVLRLGLLHAQEGGALHSVALCNADPEMEVSIEETLALEGVTAHRPRGRSFRSSSWYHLLTQLFNLAQQLERGQIELGDHPFYPCAQLVELVNNPLIAQLLYGSEYAERSENHAYILSLVQARSFPTRLRGLLRELGAWRRYHPREGEYAQSASELLQGLATLCQWLQSALSSDQALLRQLHDLALSQPPPRRVRPRVVESLHASYTQSMVTLCEQVRVLMQRQSHISMTPAPASASSPIAQRALRFLLLCCETLRCTPPRSDDASLDIMGWRDLSYSAARQLVITSFHDGAVPERWRVEAWLTPSIRQQLGLRRDAEHAAHDAYLLQSILASRLGRVSFFLSLVNSKGDPLAPSSLLFKITPREHLAALVRLLFSHHEQACGSVLPHLSEWSYRQVANPRQIPLERDALARACLADFDLEHPLSQSRGYSPALLRSFLSCPLRFWLRELYHINTQQLEDRKRELNPADLGNLIHEALEGFIRLYPSYTSFRAERPHYPEQAQQLDEQHLPELEQALLCELERSYRNNYPTDTLLPQQLQYTSIQQQLLTYAPLHLQLWKEGWYTPTDDKGALLIEYKPDWTWQGYRMNVKIDRIDCRIGPSGLEMRVIDYKTGKVDSCAKKHLASLSPESDAASPTVLSDALTPCYDITPRRKKVATPHRWIDLQLPLYAAWVEQAYPEAGLSAAYIRLSRQEGESKIVLWEGEKDHYGLFDEHDLDDSNASIAGCDAHTQQLFTHAKSWILGTMALIAEGRCLVSAELLGWPVEYDQLFGDIAALRPLHEIFIAPPLGQAPASSHPSQR